MIKQNAIVLMNKCNLLQLKRMPKVIPITLYLCCAAILKLFYSHATPGDLQWILQPTALIVEIFTGIHFSFDSLEGYCSIDREIIIAPACAGVNFMIIIFCLTASLICKFKQIRSICQFVKYLVAILIVSYSATLFINTFRIIIAIECFDAGIQWGYFTQERIHRLIGIVVYFSGACGVYLLAGKYLTQRNLKFNIETYSIYLIPLIWYLTIMVALPLVQGKQNNQSNLFLEHTLFTIGVPVVITFLLIFSTKLKKNRRIHI